MFSRLYERLRILICLHFGILLLPLSQVGISIVLLLISWAACSAHYKNHQKINSGSTSILLFSIFLHTKKKVHRLFRDDYQPKQHRINVTMRWFVVNPLGRLAKVPAQ